MQPLADRLTKKTAERYGDSTEGTYGRLSYMAAEDFLVAPLAEGVAGFQLTGEPLPGLNGPGVDLVSNPSQIVVVLDEMGPQSVYVINGTAQLVGNAAGGATLVSKLPGMSAAMGYNTALKADAVRQATAPSRGLYFDPKSISEFTAAERNALQLKHQALLSELKTGDVVMSKGSMSAQLMGELTVASEREVGLIRIGKLRLLRLGGPDAVHMADADRVIAHTHPSGVLRFSGELGGDLGDIPSFRRFQPRQRSSVLVAPDGTGSRLLIPR